MTMIVMGTCTGISDEFIVKSCGQCPTILTLPTSSRLVGPMGDSAVAIRATEIGSVHAVTFWGVTYFWASML